MWCLTSCTIINKSILSESAGEMTLKIHLKICFNGITTIMVIMHTVFVYWICLWLKLHSERRNNSKFNYLIAQYDAWMTSIFFYLFRNITAAIFWNAISSCAKKCNVHIQNKILRHFILLLMTYGKAEAFHWTTKFCLFLLYVNSQIDGWYILMMYKYVEMRFIIQWFICAIWRYTIYVYIYMYNIHIYASMI